nr:NADH dehydrogenase subunit 6 [Macrophya dolichogaster]
MMKMLLIMIMLNSLMFYSSKTPLFMGLLLLIQTMMITLMSGILSLNFWYSYILFLIMIGSMLILFIYISSLSSNQKFLFNKNSIYLNLMMMMMILISLYKLNFFLMSNSDTVSLFNIELNNNLNLKMSMNKLYNIPTNKIMFMLINYLMLTLFIVVKITNINMGPLRKNI